jgi:NAD(P)-dependent dehydrogenase (short-subunit alcohol dehydrogenase family)
MRIRFDGKTVVVSGAGHGFGRCIAETFAQLGARVFGCDLSAAELAETARAGVDTEVPDLTAVNVGFHPPALSLFHDGQGAARPPHHALRFRRHYRAAAPSGNKAAAAVAAGSAAPVSNGG